MRKCRRQYVHCSDYDVRKAGKSLLNHWDDLFTFLKIEGVEPTNNAAERALRTPVQWRKICFGNQSPDGELLTARLLTATSTCSLQNRDSFVFLVQAITAHRNGPGCTSTDTQRVLNGYNQMNVKFLATVPEKIRLAIRSHFAYT